jgi:hypothetical protein
MPVVADIGSARDIVMNRLKTAWAAQTTPPPMFYQDEEQDAPGDSTTYGEAGIEHRKGQQATIGGRGMKRFRAWAILTVTIRTPYGDRLTSSDAFVKIVQDTFEGKSQGGVDFRDVRVVEDGKDGAYNKVRVLVNFEYDRVK